MEELEKDPRIAQKIKRFRNKQAQMKHIFTEVKQYFLTCLLLFLQLSILGLSFKVLVKVMYSSVVQVGVIKYVLLCSKANLGLSQRKQVIH